MEPLLVRQRERPWNSPSADIWPASCIREIGRGARAIKTQSLCARGYSLCGELLCLRAAVAEQRVPRLGESLELAGVGIFEDSRTIMSNKTGKGE